MKCKAPSYLQDGQCIDECSDGYYPDSEGICLFNTEKPVFTILKPLIVENSKIIIINASILHIEDRDTPNSYLSILLRRKPSNGNLFVVKNGEDTLVAEEEALSIELMLRNQIYFKYEKDKPLQGNMSLSVFDGHFHSESMDVPITIISPFAPYLVKNDPLIVYKGEVSVITTQILDVHDQDNLEKVNIKVIGGPEYGELALQKKKVITFTVSDLSKNQITYTHDNSESKQDTVLFQATDGYFVINFLFHIYIVEEEKSIPVLVKNLGAHVLPNQRVQLTPSVLRASDIDSDDENLVYTLLPMLQNPGHGN